MRVVNEGSYQYCDEFLLDDAMKLDGAYVISVRMPSGSAIVVYGDLDSVPVAHIEIKGAVDLLTLPFSSPLIRVGYREGLPHYQMSQGTRSLPLQAASRCYGSVLLPS